MHEPKLPELVVLKSRLSPEVWAKRESAARQDEALMEALAAKIDGEGLSFNQAVRDVLPKGKRSWAVRRWPLWKKYGLDGLFDMRKPPSIQVTKACKELVFGARLANPRLTIDEALQVLLTGGVKALPSVSTIKRLMQAADARRRYREKTARGEEDEGLDSASSGCAEPAEEERSSDRVEIEELDLAGGELLKAAELEVCVIDTLTDEVERLGKELKAGSGEDESTGSSALRDEGKLTAEYNRARKRDEGQEIASYLHPAPDRGRKKVAADFSFVAQSYGAVWRKLAGLVYEPLVNPGRGWDGLRSTDGVRLELLVGFPYMPATLQKMASELAQLNAGPRLLRTVGLRWHKVATKWWDQPGEIAALYVDNHAKEVWSSLFTKAGKVSHRSRVMPCITTTYVQTGAGTPVLVQSRSGSSPLAPQLGELVEEAERRLGRDVRRVVVIDAEGSVFDILESFKGQQRVIVTPCRASQLRELELRYSQGSRFRPYRDHDELRVAEATLRHKSTKRELELGALLVRRDGRVSPIVLLTTGIELGFRGRALADLYFERWPLQENFFKDGTVIGLNRHRGNCGRMVTNVAVATELESLEVRLVNTETRLGRLNDRLPSVEEAVERMTVSHREAELELSVRRQEVDRLMAAGEIGSLAFSEASIAHHDALIAIETAEPALKKATEQLEQHRTKREDTLDSIENMCDRITELEPMSTIRQLDVSLDTILTAMKLALALLITFVLREYVPSDRMSTETFIYRLLTTRGRRELTKHRELIVFYANPRDPRINAALAEACDQLNRRALVRDDRELRFALENRPP
jgi:hypothetical protein